ncbi:glycosyltransferase [Erwinia sp. MYb375]|uniref:glycosyltransferase n=1 Tax=unclassified Erwinia TaxID=2622719 RepID=UPI0030AD531B
MKVLHLSKYYKPFSGGLEQVVADICEGLVEKGISTDVLCVNHLKEKFKTYSYNSVNVSSCPSNFHNNSADFSLSYINKCRHMIKDFDVIHVHLPNPLANIALMASSLRAKKIVVHWHSDIIKQKKLKYFYQPFQNWLLRRADKIITTSLVYGQQSKDLTDFQEKVVVIPIGIKDGFLKSDPAVVNKIKNDYSDKKIVFSLGRLVYYKGFEYLIEAANFLPSNTVIVIGGTGPDKAKLEKVIELNNLSEKVKLLGFVKDEDLPSWYEACDVFCLPSIEKSEAFGVVQLEAFSLNTPVVSCDIPGSGVGWVNRHGVSGLVVKPRSPEELAEAINAITSNSVVFGTIKDYFEKNFDSKVMVEKTYDLYKSFFLK